MQISYLGNYIGLMMKCQGMFKLRGIWRRIDNAQNEKKRGNQSADLKFTLIH